MPFPHPSIPSHGTCAELDYAYLRHIGLSRIRGADMEHGLRLLPPTHNSRRDVGTGQQPLSPARMGNDARGPDPIRPDRALREPIIGRSNALNLPIFTASAGGIGLGNNRMAGLRPWI